MSTGLLQVYEDAHMTIEHVVPYPAGRSFDQFSSHTCLHSREPDYVRQMVADNQGLFYLLPRGVDISQEHYIFGPLCLNSHNSLFIDNHNQSVDKWPMVDRFPGLWNFFTTDYFQTAANKDPKIFWHVPRPQHQTVLDDVKRMFALKMSQVNLTNWDHDLHQQLIASWDEDDWTMAYRLSQGTCRSLDDKLQHITNSYLTSLDVDNIDIKTHRRRALKKIIVQQLLQDTLIAKLLTGMQLSQDSRAVVTEHVIANCMIELIDSVLQQTIKQKLGK